MEGAPAVRDWVAGDAPQLLGLMRDLAVFEDYIDEFAVTERDLLERGLRERPEFVAKVADLNGALVGMAVGYDVPFTWTLRPTLHLKELFVAPSARGRGTGKALLQALAEDALRRGCAALRWSVLSGNESGAAFYRSLGARHDAKWEPWLLEGHAMRLLTSRERQ